jgi:hypothetical protein
MPCDRSRRFPVSAPPIEQYYLSAMSCRSLATTSAWAVEVTPSFFKMCRRCMAMVLKLRCNRLAMSRVVRPCQTSESTSFSRGVSGWSIIYGKKNPPYYTPHVSIDGCRFPDKRPSAQAERDPEGGKPAMRPAELIRCILNHSQGSPDFIETAPVPISHAILRAKAIIHP